MLIAKITSNPSALDYLDAVMSLEKEVQSHNEEINNILEEYNEKEIDHELFTERDGNEINHYKNKISNCRKKAKEIYAKYLLLVNPDDHFPDKEIIRVLKIARDNLHPKGDWYRTVQLVNKTITDAGYKI